MDVYPPLIVVDGSTCLYRFTQIMDFRVVSVSAQMALVQVNHIHILGPRLITESEQKPRLIQGRCRLVTK